VLADSLKNLETVPEQAEHSVRLACPCGGCVFFRAGADVPTRCGFCDSRLASTAPPAKDDPDAAPVSALPDNLASAPVRRRLFVAEIVCLLCGREAGTASAE
jgi:hypothetical protein